MNSYHLNEKKLSEFAPNLSKVEIAERKILPDEIIEILLSKDDYEVLVAFFREGREINEYLTMKLAFHPERDVRIRVGKLNQISSDVIELLKDDDDVVVRSTIASRRGLSDEIYNKIYKDEKREVKESLLINVDCPLDILKAAAKLGYCNTILERISIPDEVLSIIIDHNEKEYNEKIIFRKDIPDKIIQRFEQGWNTHIKEILDMRVNPSKHPTNKLIEWVERLELGVSLVPRNVGFNIALKWIKSILNRIPDEQRTWNVFNSYIYFSNLRNLKEEDLQFFIDKAFEISSKDEVEDILNFYLKINEYAKYTEISEKYFNVFREKSKILANASWCYSKLKNYKRSIELHEKLLKKSPKNPAFWNNAGWDYALAGNLEKALEYCLKSVQMTPAAGSLHSLGYIYRKKGEFDKAIVELKKALEYNPESSAVICDLGLSYYEKGEFKLAYDFLLKFEELGKEYDNYDKKYYEKVIADISKKIEYYPISGFGAQTAELSDNTILKIAQEGTSELKRGLALRKNLPIQVIEILSKDEDDYVLGRLASRKDLNEKAMTNLSQASWTIRYMIAGKKNLPHSIARVLSGDNSAKMRKKIAYRPNLPSDLINKFMKDPNASIREIIARRDDLDIAHITELINDKDISVARAAILDSKNLSEKFIHFLEKHELRGLREAIEIKKLYNTSNEGDISIYKEMEEKISRGNAYQVKNSLRIKKYSPQIIRILANNENDDLRCELVEYQDLPKDIITILLNDEQERVKRNLLRKEGIDMDKETKLKMLRNSKDATELIGLMDISDFSEDELIELIKLFESVRIWNVPDYNHVKRLLRHKESEDREGYRRHYYGSYYGSRSRSIKLLMEIASRPLTKKILDILLESNLRKFVASMPSLSREIILKLGRDPDENIRQSIIERKDVPIELLEEFVSDESNIIRSIVARSPLLSEEGIKKLAFDSHRSVSSTIAKRKDLSPQLILQFANAECRDTREAIASQNRLPEDVIVKLAQDSEWIVRRAIANRRTLSDSIILYLSKDEDIEVRSSIASRFKLPDEVLEILTNDKSPKIRSLIAAKSFLPKGVRSKLENDKNKMVRWMAHRGPYR